MKFTPLILSCFAISLFGQQPILIKDIVPGVESSTFLSIPGSFSLDSFYIFQADDLINGPELWVTNGTNDGTQLLKNINPSNSNTVTNIQTFTARLNNYAYFFSNDDEAGNGSIWRTDGTPSGTSKFFDDCLNGCKSAKNYALLNGKLLFPGNSSNGEEIWITDDATNNSNELKDINAGPESSQPTDFYVFKERIYFIAANGSNNREIWRTDGTSAGTELFIDIDNNNETSSDPVILGVTEEYLFFSAVSSTTVGRELWKTDGTLSGTLLVKDINPGSNNGLTNTATGIVATPFGNRLLFFANDGVNGREWWITNGEPEGTVMLKDINPGSGGIVGGKVISVLDSVVLFYTNDNVHGTELWRTNGTSDGTFLLKDFKVGSASGLQGGVASYNIATYGKKVYFPATDDNYGNEIWESDGTEVGTKRLTDMEATPFGSNKNGLQIINGYLFFTAATDQFGYEVWKLQLDEPNAAKELDRNLNFQFSVFPNPSTNYFHISGNTKIPSDILVNLTDMQGRTLLSRKYDQVSDVFIRTIETIAIPTGLYFLTLQTETGVSTRQISILGN